MKQEIPYLTVAQLAEILFVQIKAGNSLCPIVAKIDDATCEIAEVVNDAPNLQLVLRLRDRLSDSIDVWGSKKIGWLFPRVNENNAGMDVIQIDISRTIKTPPILIGFDAHRRGWSVLGITVAEDGQHGVSEVAFLPVFGGVNGAPPRARSLSDHSESA